MGRNLKALGVIPARLASTRLREKVLREIQGRPMIQHVWERAKQASKLADVIVACDDPRIASCVEGFGGHAMLTRTDHANGSSRVAEIASRQTADVFVNIQGDEPMIHPDGINGLVEVFEKDDAVRVATLAVRREDREEYLNPNVVKVVTGDSGNALYFSRAPIPHERQTSGGGFFYYKHLGIYAYRRDFLLEFVKWSPGRLEQMEKLEQLRILNHGVAIRVLETPHDSLGVDTEEDLQKVNTALNAC